MRNVDGFETYTSTAQLQGAWVSSVGSPDISLETINVCEGTKAMALNYSGATSPFTNLVRFTYGANQNWTTNSTFQVNYGGLASSNDTVLIRLLDQSGNVLKNTNIVGGTLNLPCAMVSLNLAGVPGIQATRSIELGVVAGSLADTGTVYFDALKVGDIGLLSVLGSSVAKGFGSSGASSGLTTNGSYLNGYAALLTTNQGTYGWRVVNQSIGGDTTVTVINRFYTDEVPVGATEDLIALSLGNEGLPGAANPQAIYDQFFTGMTNLIQMSRNNNIIPLIGNGYPRDPYTANEYGYLKRMDLLLNTLDVPSVNFLGATDDGFGHWINNSFANIGSGDGIHPNDIGHKELFLTIVPSVFEAVRQGKPLPDWGDRTRSLRIMGNAGQSAPLSLDTTLMHSFSVSFRVRAAGTGTVASVTLPSGTVHPTVEIAPGGIAYVGTNGVAVNSGVNGTNGAWHDIALTHQYLRGLTFFYVDGILVTNISERLTPVNFVLGGRGNASSRPGSPVQADYQDWFVHRSLNNYEEVTAQLQGKLQQASLELYAPLDDATFTQGVAVTNRAQSFSAANLNASTSDVSSLTEYLPPSNLQLTTNSTPSVILNWMDPVGASEDACYVERSAAGGPWSNIATLAAHATTCTDSSVGSGTNYQYRVSYAYAGVLSGYAISAVVQFPKAFVSSIVPNAVLIDFGRHDGGVNGAPTLSPDTYGHYWNNMGMSATAVPQNYAITNLINATNGPTTFGVKVLSTTFQCNGIQNGGLTTPDALLLGNFAIPTATEDYFFLNNGSSGISGTLRISGFNPALKYRFDMFATRNTDAATTRTSKYSVTDVNGVHAINLQTSGPGAGSAARPYGNDDTIVSLNGLVPNASGELDLVVSEVAGLFAYLGVMQISLADETPVFVVNPQSIVALANTTTSLTARATSISPVGYQWFFENSPVSGATSTNFLIPSVSISNVGSYFVVATNAQGAATSIVATVSLAPPHVPMSSVLIDLGRHDGGVNGNTTTSPDYNGNYWNNFGTNATAVTQGMGLTNIVTVNNTPTTLGLTVMSTTFQVNGIQNGGLLSPNQALLGDFAVITASEDYFFVNGTTATGTLRLSGLNPQQKYKLGMFATRTTDAATTRTTMYSVNDVNGSHSINLQTSGPGAGSAAAPYGNDDNIVYLNDLVPNSVGQLDLAITVVNGDFAYLGILQIVPMPSSSILLPVQVAGGWQVQFMAIPGYAYHVLRAPELVGPWTDIGTFVAPGNGLVTVNDTNTFTRAFYRTVAP